MTVIAVIIAFGVGGLVGLFTTALLVAGRDPAPAPDDQDQSLIGEWVDVSYREHPGGEIVTRMAQVTGGPYPSTREEKQCQRSARSLS